MDESTTGTPTQDGAGAPAEPVESGQSAAVQPQEPVSQSQPQQADETATWLQSKGLDPNDPDAFRKVVSMAYNSEKQMTKATQEASELRKSLTPQVDSYEQQQAVQGVDPTLNEFIQDYRRDKLISGFKSSHADWQEHEPAMANMLNQQVMTSQGAFTRSQLVNAGILSLEDIYMMAKSTAPTNTEQVKAETRQEVLQTLANTQRAGGGAGNATSSNPQAPDDDPIMAGIKRSRGQ